MFKHTEGPWCLIIRPDNDGYAIHRATPEIRYDFITAGTDEFGQSAYQGIARIPKPTYDIPEHESKANALLIVAVPELLDAAIEAVRFLNTLKKAGITGPDNWHVWDSEAYGQLTSAIKNAVGD